MKFISSVNFYFFSLLFCIASAYGQDMTQQELTPEQMDILRNLSSQEIFYALSQASPEKLNETAQFMIQLSPQESMMMTSDVEPKRAKKTAQLTPFGRFEQTIMGQTSKVIFKAVAIVVALKYIDKLLEAKNSKDELYIPKDYSKGVQKLFDLALGAWFYDSLKEWFKAVKHTIMNPLRTREVA